MLWQQLQDKVHESVLDGTNLDSSRPIIYVDIEQQLLSQVGATDDSIHQYPVSTSRYGRGQQEGSLKTPVGIHKISHKIGQAEPAGRVFRARIASDEICHPTHYDGQADVITSRILWLEGLQPDLNRGGNVDSYQRYIYIHGTADEAHIGQPASIGCIRMKNDDVISLFDQVEVGDLVIIE